MYLFLSLKGWQSFILWSVLCRFHSLYHWCHSLSLITIYCHSLSLVVPLLVTRYHSLSFVATSCTTCCHSMSFVTRCTTRCHSLYYSLSLIVLLVVTRCHLLSLDIALVCLFINDQFLTKIIEKDLLQWILFMDFSWLLQILPKLWLLVKMLWELTGFHMEKVFTAREFQTNYNVCVETVIYKSLMGV